MLPPYFVAGGISPVKRRILEISVRLPAIRQGDYKLVGEELYNIAEDPDEQNDVALNFPEVVKRLKERVETAGKKRPPIPDMSLLMTPALPWVYGQNENEKAKTHGI